MQVPYNRFNQIRMMKKILGLTFVIIALSFNAHSQDLPNAIGLRIFGDRFNGGELSFQVSSGVSNRLEFDLGYLNNNQQKRIYIVGMHHWGTGNIIEGLNWYLGYGSSIGFYPGDNLLETISMGIGGQLGIEYDFSEHNIPILLSIDTRPMWGFSFSFVPDAGYGWSSALSIRYVW